MGRTRGNFPYFVVAQSAEFDGSSQRLVVPLSRQAAGYPAFAPSFTIEGAAVVADALLLFSIPRDSLGPVVASLAGDASAFSVISAIDRVISTAAG